MPTTSSCLTPALSPTPAPKKTIFMLLSATACISTRVIPCDKSEKNTTIFLGGVFDLKIQKC